MKYRLKLQHFIFNGTYMDIYVPEAEHVQQLYLQQKAVDEKVIFPYWSKIWPAAYALAEFIAERSGYIEDKRVLELAAGLALPSLVAASYAATVVFSDYATDAVEIAQYSVAHNRFANVTGKVLDWQQLPLPVAADVVLISDINYDPAKFDALYNIITGMLDQGITIILSTPQRLMAKPFVERLLHFVVMQETKDILENDVLIAVTIVVLKT